MDYILAINWTRLEKNFLRLDSIDRLKCLKQRDAISVENKMLERERIKEKVLEKSRPDKCVKPF